MQAAAWVLLLGSVLTQCGSEEKGQPFITCGVENGPSPELMMHHRFTPSDLFDLSAEIVDCQFNITWILTEDASIRYLNGTKICVSRAAGNRACIRCDYTEKFESQNNFNGQKWQFHYVGFSVEENTEYFIEASNIPPANPFEDIPQKIIKLTSPDCQDNTLKYCKTCIEMGSLWDPNIFVCYTDSEVEVNFTTSSFCSEYAIVLCESDECRDYTEHTVFTTKRNDTRVAERIPVNGQNSRKFIELIPSFPKCQSDCRRYSDYQVMCREASSNGTGRANWDANLNAIYVCTVAALLSIVCTLAAILYFKRRHGTTKNWDLLYPNMKQTPTTVLVVYSQEVCFQHTVLGFAEFLHEHCKSDVIIDAWQKRRIAEIGPVQWFATQREIADKIIFLSPGPNSAACDSTCKRTIECHMKDSECMFMIAFNLFCSDLKNQSSLHKYMVVSFNETNLAKSLPSPLNCCPKYFLMKDIDSFCRDLYFSQNLRRGEGTNSKCNWRFKMNFKL
uniref:Interleukin-17 receptor B isoform X1 n=2 Tax=Pogona vitticeps TaxID=103695 RepID=A0A6J0UFX3_9SAUR